MIEDNGNDEMLVRIALERQPTKYELIIARDGAEAVDCLIGRREIFKGQPSNLSLVLLDLKLPKLNGLEVLRRIRADATIKSTPVVVWTSSCEPADLITAYELGCNSYVQKPMDFALFCNALKQITNYWVDLNRSPQSNI
jgi:two-component system, response regulator